MFNLAAPTRRSVLAGAIGATATAILGAPSRSSDVGSNASGFFRIGTGSTSGTYYPIGSIISDALNADPPGVTCAASPCTLDGRQAVPQLSNGSVSNFETLRAGTTEAGIVQADVLYNGWKGLGSFTKEGPFDGIRFVASLFPESFHLAVRPNGDIHTFRDIVGHHIALDEPGSGTIVLARVLLAAYGIKETDLKAEYVKWEGASDQPDLGHLDGLMKVAGDPTVGISFLAARGVIRLIPIAGPEIDAARQSYPFLTQGVIPAGTYPGIPETATVQVQSQLAVATDVPDELVYKITQRLWSAETLEQLRIGHPRGASITLATALAGAGIPLHPGAFRYYHEIGLIR
jgi:TRAP transporter TAXI family solute receptor